MSDSPKQFPFSTTMDLSPLVDHWRSLAEDNDSPWRASALDVLKLVEGVPELTGPVKDPNALEAHHQSVGRLMSIFERPSDGLTYAAAMVPWDMRAVFATDAAQQADLVARTVTHITKTFDQEEVAVAMAMKAYSVILSEVYDINMGFELPFSWVSFRDVESTIPIQCPSSGITRRFSVDFDPRFVRVDVVGDQPEVDPERIESLVGDPNALPELLKLLPPKHFAFRGLTLMFGEDVTSEAALTAIRDDLLMKDALTSAEGIEHIQEHVRAFMGLSDLEVGLIGLTRGDDVEAVVGGRAIGRSLLIGESGAPVCSHRSDSMYARVLDTREPVTVNDLDAFDSKTGFEWQLTEQGLRSLTILPLYADDELVGLLELASPTPGVLNSVNVFRLEKIQMIFAMGLKRSLEEQEDRIQAIIKRDYTAIHPVVEWRFRDAARVRLNNEIQGLTASAEEIVFNDLVPIYGLSDIRGSSSLRNAAIVNDLKRQLELALAAVSAANGARPQPALGELEYRIRKHVESLHPEMATDDETTVFEYLQAHLEPLLDELAKLDPTVQAAVDQYRDSLDSGLGIIFQDRRKFEQSVGLLNEIVGDVLQTEDSYAQTLVPHFFELFKTDGVDYNIYVGGGLHASGHEGELDLANLRLWQLMTMCRIEWALGERFDELPIPLRSTHLILAQSTPLAIRFRRDEKRFDVDGAYNVRYEIVKKRIDKALIRGTSERLTQPGMIAIVYSQDREAQEYRRYLEYLQAAGFVEDDVESHELEHLQGVFGLRALRVTVRQTAVATVRPDIETAIEAAAELTAKSA